MISICADWGLIDLITLFIFNNKISAFHTEFHTFQSVKFENIKQQFLYIETKDTDMFLGGFFFSSRQI